MWCLVIGLLHSFLSHPERMFNCVGGGGVVWVCGVFVTLPPPEIRGVIPRGGWRVFDLCQHVPQGRNPHANRRLHQRSENKGQ